MMMRTAQPNSPTKVRLLDAAQSLMLAKGFSATTVEEICDKAKLTKGSFFHYFESKEQLGKDVLERFCAGAQERLRPAGARQDDPLARVYAYVDTLIKLSKECAGSQGCLLGTFAQELSDTHPEIRALCEQAFGQWAQALRTDLDEAKLRHAPSASFDTKSVAEYLIAVLEGSKILARTQQNAGIVEQNLLHFRRYVDMLFSREG